MSKRLNRYARRKRDKRLGFIKGCHRKNFRLEKYVRTYNAFPIVTRIEKDTLHESRVRFPIEYLKLWYPKYFKFEYIDCPISYKKLLSIWLFSEFEATYIKAVKGELLFYSEDGKLIKRGDDMTIPENHENIKKFCNADNKEKKYLTSQMIDSRFYKISDIITDVPVEHIEK